MKLKMSAALVALTILAGCGTSSGLTNGQVAIMREEIRSDPQSRREYLDACVKVFSSGDRTWRIRLSAMTRASFAKAPAVACRRLVKGIADGRLRPSTFKPGQTRGERMMEIISG